MIKKISSLLLLLVALSAFSQNVKDQMGVSESFTLSDRKFTLNKSTKNADKSIVQEYQGVPKEVQTEKGFIPNKITVTYKPISDSNMKELLEQKIQDIRKMKNAQNVTTEESSMGFYKITFDLRKEKSVENRIIYYRYVENDGKYSAYLVEFFPGTDNKVENLDMALYKFTETILNH